MKKFWLFITLCLVIVTLAGCNCKQESTENEDKLSNEKSQFCLENGWTYSYVISPEEEYWECMFPSGIWCRDEILWTDDCVFLPDLSNIDTEEKRLAGCEENAQGWMTDFVKDAENVSIQWWEESEGGASFVRNWVIKYTKDGTNYIMGAECVADFVDGSIGVSYGDEVAESSAEVNEENTEEVAEEVVEIE